ncbi:MAG: AAA family ATPase [Chloroflexota bacterium]
MTQKDGDFGWVVKEWDRLFGRRGNIAITQRDLITHLERTATTNGEESNVDLAELDAAVRHLYRFQYAEATRIGKTVILYPKDRTSREIHIAELIRRHLATPPKRQINSTHHRHLQLRRNRGDALLSNSQMEAVLSCASAKIAILTGGPGTGKTTTSREIVRLAEEMGYTIELAAPSGRAAQRLAESTGRRAATVHKMLGYFKEDGKPGEWRVNAESPLKADFVLIDEASMIGEEEFEALLLALKPTATLLLVGDVNQLPSVSPGNILRDLIRSGVIPVSQLNEVFRQAGDSFIVTNAYRIINGQLPEMSDHATDFRAARTDGVVK